jgi:hypothetical protein
MERVVAIEHLVFMNRKQDSAIEQAERILQSAKRQFRALPGVLDVRIAVRSEQTDASRRSYGLFMRFVDSQSLAAFLPHPVHAAIGKEMQGHFTDFAVHDFAELDPSITHES